MAALFALIASVMWGTSDFLGGTFARKRKVIAVVAGSQALSLAVGIVVVVVSGEWQKNFWGWHGYGIYAILAGYSGYIGLLAFYAGLSQGTMGVVSPIAALGVVIPVAGGLIRGDHPQTVQMCGVAVAFVGALMASGPELRGKAGAKPVMYAGIAGLGFGTAQLFMALGSRESAVMTMVGMRVATFAVMGTLALAKRTVGGLGRADIPMLFVIGALDFGANVLLGMATHMGLWSIVMVLGSLYPIMTVILAAGIHKERLMKIQYCGIAFAITGVAIISEGGGA